MLIVEPSAATIGETIISKRAHYECPNETFDPRSYTFQYFAVEAFGREIRRRKHTHYWNTLGILGKTSFVSIKTKKNLRMGNFPVTNTNIQKQFYKNRPEYLQISDTPHKHSQHTVDTPALR